MGTETPTLIVCSTSSAERPVRRGPVIAVMAVAGAVTACRSAPRDLVGSWVGTLECTESELQYRTDVALELRAPSDGRHPGTLSLAAEWSDAAETTVQVQTKWDVALLQEFPRGAQDVRFVGTECTEAVWLEDGVSVLEGCDVIDPGVGARSVYWNGTDTLDWSGACEGTLERDGTVASGDSGGPSAGLR